MPITIIGAGAIGGVLGAYLIKSGEKVVFCDIDNEHVKAINKKGITIEGPGETFTVKGTAYTPEQLLEKQEELEFVFLCVKAHHTKQALAPFLPLLTAESQIVSFQNGLCERVIAAMAGEKRTIGCFVNFSADYLEPGKILYGGVASLYLGELDGTVSERVLYLKEKLQCWGPARVTENIWGYLWSKMSYAGLLYATALVDETMASVVREKKFRETLLEICSEIIETAEREKVELLAFDDWNPNLLYPRDRRETVELDRQLEKLAKRMETNKKTKSGIWRDLAVRKRKTEVDEQLVPIIQIAGEHGVEMPLTSQMVQMIKEIELGTRAMTWGNLDELKEMYESMKRKIS